MNNSSKCLVVRAKFFNTGKREVTDKQAEKAYATL